MTAVGIIEDSNMMNIEPVPQDVLEHYQQYVDEACILHISYPDINSDGYDGFIERKCAFIYRRRYLLNLLTSVLTGDMLL